MENLPPGLQTNLPRAVLVFCEVSLELLSGFGASRPISLESALHNHQVGGHKQEGRPALKARMQQPPLLGNGGKANPPALQDSTMALAPPACAHSVGLLSSDGSSDTVSLSLERAAGSATGFAGQQGDTLALVKMTAASSPPFEQNDGVGFVHKQDDVKSFYDDVGAKPTELHDSIPHVAESIVVRVDPIAKSTLQLDVESLPESVSDEFDDHELDLVQGRCATALQNCAVEWGTFQHLSSSRVVSSYCYRCSCDC